jgi:aspartate/methionine/tyrosine aminotransferase
MNSFLRYVPPMGIYETLYAFQEVFGTSMGEPETHPWSQGFPLTTQIPGGPEIPNKIDISSYDLMYPKAWGQPKLREVIADYYNEFHDAEIDLENIMIFAGGRPGLIALLLFLNSDIKVRIASTEYTPYYDMLELLHKNYELVDSSESNNFEPSVSDYLGPNTSKKLVLLSNPCNPTGITKSGETLNELVQSSTSENNGLLIDEAYEMFHDPPLSALKYINNINDSNLFVSGAATKGFQAPGIRIGWVIASKKNIEILGNFSSFGMGGVSRPSQLYATKLFDKERVKLAHNAIPKYYGNQRKKYGEAFKDLGLEVFSGNGGFYHWCKLPGKLSANELNERLFPNGAAILKGTDCDMARRGNDSVLNQFFRFSFGPLKENSFESDIKILGNTLS